MSGFARLSLVGALVASLAVLVAGAANGTGGLQPPVITEPFTPLPCPKDPAERQTTLGIKACLAQRILRSDAKINTLVKAIFGKQPDDTGRRKVIAAEKAWLTYRDAACSSEADVYRGGTAQPVAYLTCTAVRNDTHAKELSAFLEQLKRR